MLYGVLNRNFAFASRRRFSFHHINVDIVGKASGIALYMYISKKSNGL